MDRKAASGKKKGFLQEDSITFQGWWFFDDGPHNLEACSLYSLSLFQVSVVPPSFKASLPFRIIFILELYVVTNFYGPIPQSDAKKMISVLLLLVDRVSSSTELISASLTENDHPFGGQKNQKITFVEASFWDCV